MRLFIDANVLVSVLNKEYPLYFYSSRIISLADRKGFSIYTTPLCLGIAFYFSEKKCGTLAAKEKIAQLVERMKIAVIHERDVKKALTYKSIHDFEDGMEYFAAMNEKCQCIITQNLADFYFSEVEVSTCEQFLKKYFNYSR